MEMRYIYLKNNSGIVVFIVSEAQQYCSLNKCSNFFLALSYFWGSDGSKSLLSTKGADAWRPAAAAPWKQRGRWGGEGEGNTLHNTYTNKYLDHAENSFEKGPDMSMFQMCLAQSSYCGRPSLMCILIQERLFSLGQMFKKEILCGLDIARMWGKRRRHFQQMR